MQKKVTILTGEPVVELIGQMTLVPRGLEGMARWVREHRPECLPENYETWRDLFPHDLMRENLNDLPDNEDVSSPGTLNKIALTENELLVELAGRKCYDSFGLKAGKKTNSEYIANTQGGPVAHASILYHAKMSFFFAGLSRRVSHELIRNYVGSDRDEEGAPSQESTRFTHHYGFFVCPPRRLGEDGSPEKVELFRTAMQAQYDRYVEYVEHEVAEFERNSANGKKPTGLERKRIYEDASAMLPHAAETSFIWTTNPVAIAKLVREREDNVADLEIARFAKVYRQKAYAAAPNLFPQPWMQPRPGEAG